MNRGFLAIFVSFLALSLLVAVGWNIILDVRTRGALRAALGALVIEANASGAGAAQQESRERFRGLAVPPSAYRYELSGHAVAERDGLVQRHRAGLQRRLQAADTLYNAFRIGDGGGRLEDVRFLKTQARTAAHLEVGVVSPEGAERAVRLIMVRRFSAAERGTPEARRWYPEGLLSYRDSTPGPDDVDALEEHRIVAADPARRAALTEALTPPLPTQLPPPPLPAVAARAALDAEIAAIIADLAGALGPRKTAALSRLRETVRADTKGFQRMAVAASLESDTGPFAQLKALWQRHRAAVAPLAALPGHLADIGGADGDIEDLRAAITDMSAGLPALADELDTDGVSPRLAALRKQVDAVLEAEGLLHSYNRWEAARDAVSKAAVELAPLRQAFVRGEGDASPELIAARRGYAQAVEGFETTRDAYLSETTREDRAGYDDMVAVPRFERSVAEARLTSFLTALADHDGGPAAAVSRADAPGTLVVLEPGGPAGLFRAPGDAGQTPRLVQAFDRETDYRQTFAAVSDRLRGLYNRERQQEENPDAKGETVLKDTVRALTPYLGRAPKPRSVPPPAAPPPDETRGDTETAAFMAWLGLEPAPTPPPGGTQASVERFERTDLWAHLAHDTVSAAVRLERERSATAAFKQLSVLSFSVDEHLDALRAQVAGSSDGGLKLQRIEPMFEPVARHAAEMRDAADRQDGTADPAGSEAVRARADAKTAASAYREAVKVLRREIRADVHNPTRVALCRRHADALEEMVWIRCRRPEFRAGSLYVIDEAWDWAREAAPEAGHDYLGAVVKVRFKGLMNMTHRRTETNVYQYEKEIAHQDWYVYMIAHERDEPGDPPLRERRWVPVRFQPADEPLDRAFLETEIERERQRRTRGD